MMGKTGHQKNEGCKKVFLGEAGVSMCEIWKKQYLFVFCILKFLIENAQSDTFKAPCCCFDNAPDTALTIVCTISIDCNWFDVPNPFTRKNILK